MAKTVNEAFDILLKRLTPSGTESATAASHRATIKACLESNFGMTSFFHSGSFGHGTSVSGHSDVDYFAVIPRENLSNDSQYTLRKIKEALERRFPRTNVVVRSPGVVVPFGSSASEVHEIIPADYVKRTGDFNIYDIPDRAGGWMRASPRAHNTYVTNEHNRLRYKLKPLIRLVKAWKYYRDAPIRSFYMELRITESMSDESSIVYKFDVRKAFRRMIDVQLRRMQDPQGISGYVYAGSDADKNSALPRLERALARANHAREAEERGDIKTAFDWWDKVFNGKFPAYH